MTRNRKLVFLFALSALGLIFCLGIYSTIRPDADARIASGEILANGLGIYPSRLVRAVLCAEDAGFFEHQGIDLRASVWALGENLKRRKIYSGASTISQQLARGLHGYERTFWGKAQTLAAALAMERQRSKTEILGHYMESVDMGDGVVGLGHASREYLGKEPQELTLEDAALLAGMVRSPRRYDPRLNPRLAWERRKNVLKRMLEDHAIPESRFREASTAPLVFVRDGAFEEFVHFGDSRA